IEKLSQGAQVACGGPKPVDGIGAPSGKGYFVAPTLLVNRSPKAADAVNQHEVFGPVATLMPYADARGAIAMVAAGGGGLVSSIYSDDKAFTQEVALGIAPFHGRITLGSE